MSTALAALSRYPISGSLEARSSSGPAAMTLGAIGTTSAVAGGVRRSQPRIRAARLSAPFAPTSVIPGAPADASPAVIDSEVSSDAPPGVTSVSRDAGAVPLALPICCVMSHSGFAARLATHLHTRKIAIRDRYGSQALGSHFLRGYVTVSPVSVRRWGGSR
jgi:hypothetical protein